MLPRLRNQFEALAARRAKFEAGTRALSEAQLRFRPAEGAWSIAEVAQHLLQVESEVVRATSRPDVQRRGRKRTAKEWVGFWLFQAIVHLNVRIKVPQRVAGRVTPAANPEMNRLWAEWSAVHADLARYLETVGEEDLGQMAFKHPIMGPTNLRDMLPFLRNHFDHHLRQVRRIRGAPGFPPA